MDDADSNDIHIDTHESKRRTDTSPVFELDWDRPTATEPQSKRGRVTNLFDQSTSAPLDDPVRLPLDRLLVAATPDASPEKDMINDAVDELVVSGAENNTTLVNLEEDDTFLLEAAEAAEVAWLTEGLLAEEESV